MASDQEIAEGLGALFRETNPNAFNSLNEVVLRLQSNLGFDLSHKMDFIRSQINLLLAPPPQPQLQPPSQANVATRPLPSNPNPNCGSYHPNVPHHPHAHVRQRQQRQRQQQQQQQQLQQHLFHSQSHFPMGATEICFAQPGSVLNDPLSSPPLPKDSSQKPKRRGGPGGLNKLCGVTPQLQAIVGQPTLPRTEIVKQLWAYIRKNNLQHPSNKRKIICNDELRLVFEVDCTDMFQMNKLLAKHILPLSSPKESEQLSKKIRIEEVKLEKSLVPSSEPSPIVNSEREVEESPVPRCGPAPPIVVSEVNIEESPVPGSESAPLIVISEALANFFGVSEMKMLQSDVYKRIEEYIKTEGLEDPLNSVIICDRKLQELFGCESITTSAIGDALARNHLFQQA